MTIDWPIDWGQWTQHSFVISKMCNYYWQVCFIRCFNVVCSRCVWRHVVISAHARCRACSSDGLPNHREPGTHRYNTYRSDAFFHTELWIFCVVRRFVGHDQQRVKFSWVTVISSSSAAAAAAAAATTTTACRIEHCSDNHKIKLIYCTVLHVVETSSTSWRRPCYE